MRTCPICQKTGISDNSENCPQCGTVFPNASSAANSIKMMESLRETSLLRGQNEEFKGRIESLNHKIIGLHAKNWAYLLLFGFCFVIGCSYHRYKVNSYEDFMRDQRLALDIHKKNQEKSLKIINTYQKMVAYNPTRIYIGKAVSPRLPLVNEVLYVVETGDDLETVSTFFFGTTNFAHNIGFDNHIGDHDKIQPNDTLRIRSKYQ